MNAILEHKPLTYIVNSKQEMLVDFVKHLRYEDKVNLQACLAKQSDACKYISIDEFNTHYRDGNYCYVLIMDVEGICHGIIGRQWPEDDDSDSYSDELPEPKTVVIATLGPSTIRGLLSHAVKFARRLLLIDMFKMPELPKQDKYHFDYAYQFERRQSKRAELARQIKLIKAIVATFDHIDNMPCKTEQEFTATVFEAAKFLRAKLHQLLYLDIVIENVKLTEFANESSALYVSFNMPCYINGKYDRFASVMPTTVGSRHIAIEDRPKFMLQRSIVAMLNVFSYNVERHLQCTMSNFANNVIYHDEKMLISFVPCRYRKVLVR